MEDKKQSIKAIILLIICFLIGMGIGLFIYDYFILPKKIPGILSEFNREGFSTNNIETLILWEGGIKKDLNLSSEEILKLVALFKSKLHQLNLQARCVFNEGKIKEIKRNNKVVEMVFKQTNDFPINQWVQEEERYHIPTNEKDYRILENIKSVILVLEDNLDEGMEGYILVGSERKDRDKRCSRVITQEDLEKLGSCEAIRGYTWNEQYGCNAIGGCKFDYEIVPFKTKEECEFACGRIWSCWTIQKEGGKEIDKTWIDEVNKIINEAK